VTQAATQVEVAGAALVGDPAGALFWPERGLLAVADLHLEKGSSFAARGVLLPPYDTAATLARLGRLIAHYAPRLVVALGDSFHDRDGPARVAEADRATLRALQRGREWIWIAGNHDPEPAAGIGGSFSDALACGPIVFRHAPRTGALSGKVDAGLPRKMRPSQELLQSDGEIAGHLHPVARVVQRGRTTSRRCFAGDGRRLVMPAFGAYTGGLNVRDRAFADVFGTISFTANMLGEKRLYAIAAQRCLAD
jgi:DNA ligase-associated metallophosphoesterase